MYGPCDTDLLHKPGKVVYLNGEPYAADVLPHSFYLGPLSLREMPPSVKQFKFSYVQMAALEIGDISLLALERRPYYRKTKFLIYTSSRCLKHREAAFDMFAAVSTVSAGGKCHGSVLEYENIVEPGGRLGNSGWRTAHRLLLDYKFALVMENTNVPAYITEKLLNAFVAGCVPIYYGTEDVFDIFNKDAFVYFNESSPEEAVTLVRHLMEDPTAYERKRRQPILAEGAMSKYFSLFYEQKGVLASQIRKHLEIQDR